MRSPGAVALADLLRQARRKPGDLVQIGGAEMHEVTTVILEQCDAIAMQATGTRCSPDHLRDAAAQAGALAAELRRVAAEREAS